MRVTTKGARAFFLLMLTVLAILGIYQCFTMANAFNLSPYTFKLRSKTTAADSLYIKGDTLYCNQMAVSLHAVMQAVAVQTDTVRGSSTIVGITDDTLIVDADSTGSAVTIRFGRWGGGLRWNRATDAMQYTNDFSTWTAIGTGGSSTTNADSLFHIPAFVRPQTDGYVLKFDADGDSLYLSADATGAAGDSNAIIYETDRLASYSDSAMYFGDIGDSTMMRFLGDSAIISFAKIYYGEEVVDSALVTYGTLEAAVAALGSGDITGVITSGDWLEGGSSSGDVALNVRAEYEAAFNINGDTTTIDGDFIKLYDGIGASIVMGLGSVYWDAESYYQYANTAISMGVGGGSSEFQIASQNNVYFGDTTDIRVPRAKIATWSMLYDSADYKIRGVGVGAAGTMFVGTGTSAAPAFTSIHSILDTLFAVGDAAGDTMWANTPGYATKANVHDSIYAGGFATKANVHDSVYAPGFATKANVHDSVYAPGFLPRVSLKDSINATKTHSGAWTLTGDWVNTTNPWADNEVANNLTIDDAGIASTITRDTEAQALIRDSLFANSNAFLKAVALKDSINATKSHSGVWTLTGNWVNTTNPWADNEVADNITAGYADSTGKTTHGSIDKWDLATACVDSTKIVDGSVSTADLRDTLISTGKLKNAAVTAVKVDTSGSYIFGNARTPARSQSIIRSNNFASTDAESTLKLGSAAGLTITSSILLGTDITDDTLVVDYYPEYDGAVLSDLIIPTWKDSIKIYGYIDTVAGMGNTMYFNDSVLTSGLHRRGVQLAIKHPLRVDSLRYIIVQGLVKDSSGTNSMYLKGMLRTSNFRAANVDSNAASTIKDYDSLGGDFTDVASVRQFVLSGGAITEGSPWYLLLIARHVSGTAWNWAQVGRVRAVYSRTRL